MTKITLRADNLNYYCSTFTIEKIETNITGLHAKVGDVLTCRDIFTVVGNGCLVTILPCNLDVGQSIELPKSSLEEGLNGKGPTYL